MKRFRVALVLALLASWPLTASGQMTQAVTRIFAAPPDRVWAMAESVLKSLGWSIDEKDKAGGWILTDSRAVDFKDFGVYGEGTRHKLRVTLRPMAEGWTSVAVERELYREERILWMKERKPLQTTDRSIELTVLDGIANNVPAVAAAPAPTPGAAPTPAPAPARPSAPGGGSSGSAVASRSGSRGEFTYKITYRVTGSAGAAHLTYRNAEGGTVQQSVRIPWELSFDAKGGTFLSVSAQNQGVAGSVTCEILLDGESRTTSTSSGAYVIAECSNSAERN